VFEISFSERIIYLNGVPTYRKKKTFPWENMVARLFQLLLNLFVVLFLTAESE